jgi:hypothetical protein
VRHALRIRTAGTAQASLAINPDHTWRTCQGPGIPPGWRCWSRAGFGDSNFDFRRHTIHDRLHRSERSHFIVVDVDTKLVFDSHRYFHNVEVIESEIMVQMVGALGLNVRFHVDGELFRKNLLHAILDALLNFAHLLPPQLITMRAPIEHKRNQYKGGISNDHAPDKIDVDGHFSP